MIYVAGDRVITDPLCKPFSIGSMPSDDSQNLSYRDYDDQGDEETLSASGGSSPGRSDEVFVVQPVEPLVVRTKFAPTRVPSKKKSHRDQGISARPVGPSVSKLNLTSGKFLYLDPCGAYGNPVDVSVKEEEQVEDILGGTVRYRVNHELDNIIDCHSGKLIGVHVDSLKGGLRFPLDPFFVKFVNYYGIVPGQIAPNGHRILECFQQICRRHHVPCTVELFNFLHLVKPMGKNNGSGFIMIQSPGVIGKISDLPDNHRRWRNKFLRVRLDDEPPFTNVWSEQMRKCVSPRETSLIRTAMQRISSESYTWENFNSPNALKSARLPPPSYEATDQNITGGRSVGEIVQFTLTLFPTPCVFSLAQVNRRWS